MGSDPRVFPEARRLWHSDYTFAVIAGVAGVLEVTGEPGLQQSGLDRTWPLPQSSPDLAPT